MFLYRFGFYLQSLFKDSNFGGEFQGEFYGIGQELKFGRFIVDFSRDFFELRFVFVCVFFEVMEKVLVQE